MSEFNYAISRDDLKDMLAHREDECERLRALIRDIVMVFEELREGHDFEMQSRLLISIERLLQRAEAL